MLLTIYNNQLIECEVYGVFTINKETKKKELQECELHHNGKVFNVPKEHLFYFCKGDYESGNANVLSFKEDINFYPCAYLKCTCYPYYLEDGQIKQFDPLYVVRKFKVKYNCCDAIILEADIPDVEMYSSREELLAYNSYEVIKDDGSIERHEGYMQRFLLDEKQKEILDRLRSVVKEATATGIQFMFDREYSKFFVINDKQNNISKCFAGCEDGYDKELYIPRGQSLNEFDLYDYNSYDYGINLDKLNGNE